MFSPWCWEIFAMNCAATCVVLGAYFLVKITVKSWVREVFQEEVVEPETAETGENKKN